MNVDDLLRLSEEVSKDIDYIIEKTSDLKILFKEFYEEVNRLPAEDKQKIMKYLNRDGVPHVAVIWTPNGFEEWTVAWEYDPDEDLILITSHDEVDYGGEIVVFEPDDLDRWTALIMLRELADAVLGAFSDA